MSVNRKMQLIMRKIIQNSIFFLVGSLLLTSGCKHGSKKIYHIRIDTAYCCDSNEQKFYTYLNQHWPKTKPKNVVDAIRLLDSVADENSRNEIANCKTEDFYFTLGLTIRNEWVRNGDEHFRNQLFNQLKLSHEDYSSGLILYIYKVYLLDSTVNIMDKVNTKDSGFIKNVLDIQNSLKKMRRNIIVEYKRV